MGNKNKQDNIVKAIKPETLDLLGFKSKDGMIRQEQFFIERRAMPYKTLFGNISNLEGEEKAKVILDNLGVRELNLRVIPNKLDKMDTRLIAFQELPYKFASYMSLNETVKGLLE